MVTEFIKRNKVFIIYAAIFALAIYLRLFQFGEVPNGLYQDETAIGFNAYSILETGKDEYGKNFPLYFKSFGDYKLPVYIYLTVIPVKIFGLTDFAPRVASVFFSILTVGLFYFFVKRISKNTALALVSMLLLAINPWHLHYGRATFEVSVALFFFLSGSFLLLEKKKNIFISVLGVGCFVVALYTYNLTRLLSPALLFLVFSLNIKEWKKVTLVHKLVVAGVIVLGFIPLLLSILNPEGVQSASGTLITSSAAIQAPLLELRSYMIGTPILFQKLFFSHFTLTGWEYIRHIASYGSFDFYFLNGSSHGNHGIGNFGQFYLFESFTILLGLIVAFMKKEQWRMLAVLWGIIVIAVCALTREAPHATRSFFLILPLTIFSAYGMIVFFHYINSRTAKIKIIYGVFVSAFFLYNIIFYFSSYYQRFPIFYAKNWRSEDGVLSKYVKDHESKYEKIVIDESVGIPYTSFLYYLTYSPEVFQRTVQRDKDDSEGFSKVKSFGKFEFRKIDWNKDLTSDKTLFITTFENQPEEKYIVEKILYPQRPVVINVGQEIHQFPVTDVAYVLVEKK